eukprot:scaffold66144_cov32-Tisochrysis_lutea.AAC.1
MTEKMPERTGEMTQESTMPVMPPGMNSLSAPDFLYHTTQSAPLVTMAMPTRPPHAECVVETGISRAEARRSQIPTAPTTHKLPYIRMAASIDVGAGEHRAEELEDDGKRAGLLDGESLRANRRSVRIGHVVGADAEGGKDGGNCAEDDDPRVPDGREAEEHGSGDDEAAERRASTTGEVAWRKACSV